MSRSLCSYNKKYIKQYNRKKYQNKQNQNKTLLTLEKQYNEFKNIMNIKKLQGFQISIKELQQICQIMNVIAVILIKQGQLQKAQDWLIRGQKYAIQLPKMKITIYNNLSCLYKKQQNYGLALVYLQKADVNIQKLINKEKNICKDFIIADCSLNMCAILSSMGEHLLALQQARKTINCLENFKNFKRFDNPQQNIQKNENLENKYYKEVYLVAKFNQATELQHLHKWQKSLEVFKQGLNYGIKHLPQNSLILQIKVAIQSLQKKVSIVVANKNRIQRNWKIRSITSSPRLESKERQIQYQTLNENYQTIVKSSKIKTGRNTDLKVYFKENYTEERLEKISTPISGRKRRMSLLKQIN